MSSPYSDDFRMYELRRFLYKVFDDGYAKISASELRRLTGQSVISAPAFWTAVQGTWDRMPVPREAATLKDRQLNWFMIRGTVVVVAAEIKGVLESGGNGSLYPLKERA